MRKRLRIVESHIHKWGRLRRLRRLLRAKRSSVYGVLPPPSGAKVLLLSMSSGAGDLGFNQLANTVLHWGLRARGCRVTELLCSHAVPRCPLNVRQDWTLPGMFCRDCVGLRESTYPADERLYLHFDPGMAARLGIDDETPLADLLAVTHMGLPLGELCVPSLRRALRRFTLDDHPFVRHLAYVFVVGAASLAEAGERALDEQRPDAVVVFNGVLFPEAVVRQLAARRGIGVLTYEIGYRPTSIFLSPGLATEYRIDADLTVPLTAEEDAQLDRCLEDRAKGRFQMGGLVFWPEMAGADAALRARLEAARRVVAIFPNTPYDTSTVTSNLAFRDMFEWLQVTLAEAEANPDVVFIVRSHPDEIRYGKPSSHEPVSEWVRRHFDLPNVINIPADDRTSSYELLSKADVAVVYNSTIGLEAAIWGKPVLCGGRTKYSDTSFAVLHASKAEYVAALRRDLGGDRPEVGDRERAEARRLFHHLFFRASVDLSAFLMESERKLSKGVYHDVLPSAFSPSLLLPGAHAGLDRLCGEVLAVAARKSAGA